MPSKLALAVSLLIPVLVLGAALPSLATTYTVTSTADSGTGSLRAAIGMAANGDMINFNLTYPATITLTSGYLEISTDVTITGPGAANLIISGGKTSQAFQVDSTVTGVGAAISGVTIQNGFNSTSMAVASPTTARWLSLTAASRITETATSTAAASTTTAP